MLIKNPNFHYSPKVVTNRHHWSNKVPPVLEEDVFSGNGLKHLIAKFRHYIFDSTQNFSKFVFFAFRASPVLEE